jgi:hypothetical protein
MCEPYRCGQENQIKSLLTHLHISEIIFGRSYFCDAIPLRNSKAVKPSVSPRNLRDDKLVISRQPSRPNKGIFAL